MTKTKRDDECKCNGGHVFIPPPHLWGSTMTLQDGAAEDSRQRFPLFVCLLIPDPPGCCALACFLASASPSSSSPSSGAPFHFGGSVGKGLARYLAGAVRPDPDIGYMYVLSLQARRRRQAGGGEGTRQASDSTEQGGGASGLALLGGFAV